MEREIKTITTPIHKHKVELNAWITGQEYEDIQAPMNNIKFSLGGVGSIKSEITAGEVVKKTEEVATNIILVSIDGDKKDLVNRLRQMHKNDYLFVLKEIDSIAKNEDFTQP